MDPERRPVGLWQVVLAALESNAKVIRLVVILVTLAVLVGELGKGLGTFL